MEGVLFVLGALCGLAAGWTFVWLERRLADDVRRACFDRVRRLTEERDRLRAALDEIKTMLKKED